MYNHGCISRKGLEKRFHMIDSRLGFQLWSHNYYAEDALVIVDIENMAYAYTHESIDYVMYNKDDYTWYKFRPIG